MNGTRNRKKKRFWKPVAAVFLALYLVTMGLVTLMVEQKFEDEYIRTFEQTAASIHRKAADQEDSMQEEQRREYYQYLVNEYFWSSPDPQLNIAVAVYDKEQNLLADSYDAIGDMMYTANSSEVNVDPFALDDYLTFGQKEELAEYYWKGKQSAENGTLPEKYRILIRTSLDGKELYGIFVQEITWEEGEEDGQPYKDPLTGEVSYESIGLMIDYATGKEYGTERVFHITDSKAVWEWANPDISEERRESGEIRGTSLVFPYMASYERWHRWSSSEYLHGFPNPGEFSQKEEETEYPSIYSEREGLLFRCKYKLKVGYVDDPYAYMEIRMEERPWADAFEYMKYLYLAGLLLTAACIFVVSHTFGQAYVRQAVLEETRRDITNAMAHELKTPLGIIRNFAENLIEHNMEEKRDYYLAQIVGQTEEMDSLVAEMIEISKLDSEELALKKEKVSFGELIREEMTKFAPMVDEKNIQVQYREEADFLVEGDREYLAKAVWNLISNAVDYNVLDGRIVVRTEAGMCSIENTGETMEEEQLLHAFDLFYTGNQSRGKKEKHMGIGLFLVKKILMLHGMGVAIESTDEGIRVVVKKS